MNDGIARVDCDGCTACCKRELIPLMPGDDPALYQTEERHGLKVLRRKENGECIHLGPQGCEVWPKHPMVCKRYDCVADYLKRPRAERRRLSRMGVLSSEVLAAGRERAKKRGG